MIEILFILIYLLLSRGNHHLSFAIIPKILDPIPCFLVSTYADAYVKIATIPKHGSPFVRTVLPGQHIPILLNTIISALGQAAVCPSVHSLRDRGYRAQVVHSQRVEVIF